MSACLCEWGHESHKGVKISPHSRINRLSHVLTFTRSWSTRGCNGVALGVCISTHCVEVSECVCVCKVSPPPRRKAPLMWDGAPVPCQVQRRVTRKLWDFPVFQLCVFMCFTCLLYGPSDGPAAHRLWGFVKNADRCTFYFDSIWGQSTFRKDGINI